MHYSDFNSGMDGDDFRPSDILDIGESNENEEDEDDEILKKFRSDKPKTLDIINIESKDKIKIELGELK